MKLGFEFTVLTAVRSGEGAAGLVDVDDFLPRGCRRNAGAEQLRSSCAEHLFSRAPCSIGELTPNSTAESRPEARFGPGAGPRHDEGFADHTRTCGRAPPPATAPMPSGI